MTRFCSGRWRIVSIGLPLVLATAVAFVAVRGADPPDEIWFAGSDAGNLEYGDPRVAPGGPRSGWDVRCVDVESVVRISVAPHRMFLLRILDDAGLWPSGSADDPVSFEMSGRSAMHGDGTWWGFRRADLRGR